MIWKKKKDAAAQSAEAAGEMTGAKGRTGAGAFAKKNWKWLVPLVVVAAAGAVLLIGGGRNGAASRDVTYAETTPVRQDVSNSLSGTGTLNPANTYTVKSLVDGKILTGGFEEGDKVEEGDVLYTIDSSDASTNLEKASIALQQAQRSYDKTVDRQYVRAEVDGTVSSLKVAKGDEVTSGQEVAVIRDSSKMLLNLLFLIIGMLMEANAAIIMMTPILMPLLTLYGINPLMFGIVMSFNLCIGLVTPPVGMCLLLSNQIGETSLSKSLKALMPMLLISIVVLLLITYVDPLTTWLPSLLKK